MRDFGCMLVFIVIYFSVSQIRSIIYLTQQDQDCYCELRDVVIQGSKLGYKFDIPKSLKEINDNSKYNSGNVYALSEL
jgi:hypothetical protein